MDHNSTKGDIRGYRRTIPINKALKSMLLVFSAFLAAVVACSSGSESANEVSTAPVPTPTSSLASANSLVVKLLNLGARKIPPASLSIESPSLPNDELRNTWLTFLTGAVIADNAETVPIVHLCENAVGIWAGSSEVHNELSQADRVSWVINTVTDRPGAIRDINNGIIITIFDGDGILRFQSFTLEVKNPQDAIGEFLVHESLSCPS